ncbi:type II secretion system minor pseudopilin GspK [Marinobacter sp. chi1]|uniref:Type II secretion system protein K n=1 Tax=Marinobacter suaedae TaxID=3057675 RepID=A0ABT8W1I8_9GAMM|nr:type II secretion system minor pseudopilin GspK [Marinobacter sp. chi1]MDO3722099.1 type II secretion system minor pseudopilin GspK [Marinobacter sp. chi1]
MSVPLFRQKGIALIMVLLAMALVVMLATGMTKQQTIRVFKAGHFLSQQQGTSIALGAEAYARVQLFTDHENDQEDSSLVDTPFEDWAGNSAILPLDDGLGVVQAQIDDLGGRINLNDLVNENGEVDLLTQQRLERLLIALDIDSIEVAKLIDWIDSNDQPVILEGGYGAEDGQYLSQEPGYRTGNQPFANVSELLLIEGVEPEDVAALREHVTALPVTGLGINVNFASPEVLQSLHEDLTPGHIADIEEALEESQGFDDLQEFLALNPFAGLGLNRQGLSVRTHFFEVAARITYDNRIVYLHSTIYRNGEGEMQTVSRDFGRKIKDDDFKDPVNFSEG